MFLRKNNMLNQIVGILTRHKWREEGDERTCEVCGRHQNRLPDDDWGRGFWTTTKKGLSLEHWLRLRKAMPAESPSTNLATFSTTNAEAESVTRSLGAK